MVGEIGLFLATARTASVVTDQPTCCYRLGRRALEELQEGRGGRHKAFRQAASVLASEGFVPALQAADLVGDEAAAVLTSLMSENDHRLLAGAIAGLAVMTKTELLLVLLGGIFVIEALSVAIQVISFQTTRKRVFLMAPIHHHFELRAWSETKIILRFWIVAAICCAIGFTIYRQSIG